MFSANIVNFSNVDVDEVVRTMIQQKVVRTMNGFRVHLWYKIVHDITIIAVRVECGEPKMTTFAWIQQHIYRRRGIHIAEEKC